MIDRHGDQRGAAGDIDGVDAPLWLWLVRHVRFRHPDIIVSMLARVTAKLWLPSAVAVLI